MTINRTIRKTIAIFFVMLFILPSVCAAALPVNGNETPEKTEVTPVDTKNDFWIEIIGRGAIQNGVAVPYLIRYGNNGTQNIPAPLIAFYSIPGSSDVYAQTGSSDWKPMKDLMIIASKGSDEKPEILSPGSSYSIPVRIIAYNNTQFSLSAASLSTTPLYYPSITESSIDGSCPSPGIPLEFTRSYPNGYSSYDGPLGYGWVHSFDIHIERMDDGNIVLKQGNSYIGIFLDMGDGTYTSQNGDLQFMGNAENTLTLESKSGNILKFNPYGYLEYVQDNRGNSISLTYDNQKKLISVQHSSGDIFKFEYTDNGKISRFIDHAGRSTTYSYNPTERLLSTVITPDGSLTQYKYVPQIGGYALSSVVYPDNTEYTFKFDDNGYPVEQSQSNGQDKIQFSYNPAARITKISDDKGNTGEITLNSMGQMVSTQSADGGISRYAYDSNGMVSALTDSSGRTTRFDYDAGGNVAAISDPNGKTVTLGYDQSSQNPVWIQDSLNRKTKYSYDKTGNLVEIKYPDSSAEKIVYNDKNLPSESKDPLDKTTKYTWNHRGQITSLEDARGYSTRLSFDTAGNLDKISDFRGNSLSYGYDSADRMLKTTYPDGSTEQYAYDKNGDLESYQNRAGEKIIYDYNDAGQFSGIQYPSGKKIQYSYNEKGDLVSVEENDNNNLINTSYTIDTSGEVTGTTVKGLTAQSTPSITYEYDSNGTPTAMKYPDGYTLHYRYDLDTQLTEITDDTQHTLVAYKYDTIGLVTQRTLGNGLYTTYDYDVMDRLTKLVNHAADGKIISEYSYSYNPAGIVTLMKSQEGEYRYSYDNDYQLTKVEYPDRTSVEYEYDAAGNRISVKDQNGKTDYKINNLDQYTQAGMETFTYDKKGNIASRQMGNISAYYSWDEDNRLTGIIRGDVTINYQYDISGRLITKKTGTTIIHYIWDGANLIAETDGNGNIITRYVFGNDIDEIVLATQNNQNAWILQDRIGSTTSTIDDRGLVTGQGNYEVYGIPQNSVTIGIPQRFAGMRWDDDAQLYYVRNRWYDPELGRFISPDYIQSSLKSQYNYAENSPAHYIDPLGLHQTTTDQNWKYENFYPSYSGGSDKYQDLKISAIKTVYGTAVTIGFDKHTAKLKKIWWKYGAYKASEDIIVRKSNGLYKNLFRSSEAGRYMGIIFFIVDLPDTYKSFVIAINSLSEKSYLESVHDRALFVTQLAGQIGNIIPGGWGIALGLVPLLGTSVDVGSAKIFNMWYGQGTIFGIEHDYFYKVNHEGYISFVRWADAAELTAQERDEICSFEDFMAGKNWDRIAKAQADWANKKKEEAKKNEGVGCGGSSGTIQLLFLLQCLLGNTRVSHDESQQTFTAEYYDSSSQSWREVILLWDSESKTFEPLVRSSTTNDMIEIPTISSDKKVISSKEVLSDEDYITARSQDEFSAQMNPDDVTIKINPNVKIPQEDIEKSGSPKITPFCTPPCTPDNQGVPITISPVGQPSGYSSTYRPGGVDFSNIQLNSLSISDDSNTQIFSYTMKTTIAQPGEQPVNIENATDLSIKAFFTGLVMPNSAFWVNLHPKEKDHVIDSNLAKTDVGRVMLQADLDMKKDYARFENGCVYSVGAEYIKIIDQKENDLLNDLKLKYPDDTNKIDQIQFKNTIGHWIGPDTIKVRMDKNQVFIDTLSLNITRNPTDQDADFQVTDPNTAPGFEFLNDLFIPGPLKEDLRTAGKEYLRYAAEQEDLMITPLVLKEVNTAPKYADLRRVYSSLALAQWYKEKSRGTKGLFSDKIDSRDLKGLEAVNSWKSDDLYNEYLKSYNDGEFLCERNLTKIYEGKTYTYPSTYQVGGVVFSKIRLTQVSEVTRNVDQIMKYAIFQDSAPSAIPESPSSFDSSDEVTIQSVSQNTQLYTGDSIYFMTKPVSKPNQKPANPSPKGTTSPAKWPLDLIIIAVTIVIGVAVFIKLKPDEDDEDDYY